MIDEIYGVTTFCDDIRFEIGGKLTLIGCYSGEMTVFAVSPVALPMFCALANLRMPVSQNFNRLDFVLFRELNGSQVEIFRDGFDAPPRDSSIIPEANSPYSPSDRQTLVAFPIKIAPLLIEGDCLIRCRAYLDGTEIKIGSLRVKVQNESEEQPEQHITPATS